MTIDDLAQAIQGDFAALRKDMATKQDLALAVADLRSEMTTRFAGRSELRSEINSAKEELLEEIGKIKYAKEIDELRARVQLVERKLGIGHGRADAGAAF